MKLPERIKNLNSQTRWMIILILLLLIMIITRWDNISHMAGEAFKARFIPTSEQADTLE